MFCVFTVPSENSHKVVSFMVDSNNTKYGGKSIMPWQPKHKTHKQHWGTSICIRQRIKKEKEMAG
jgi:hypothetical protein